MPEGTTSMPPGESGDSATGLIGMTELADILKTNVQTLTNWLVKIDLFRKQTSQSGGGRNLPRKKSQDDGHFVVKTELNNGRMFPIAYATPKGVALVTNLWEQRGNVGERSA